MHRSVPLFLLAAALGITGAAPPAAAERLVTSLSEHRVMVTSSFNGSEVVLFGGIERDAGVLPLRTKSTICRLNSGVYRTLLSAISNTSKSNIEVSTKTGQLQFV